MSKKRAATGRPVIACMEFGLVSGYVDEMLAGIESAAQSLATRPRYPIFTMLSRIGDRSSRAHSSATG